MSESKNDGGTPRGSLRVTIQAGTVHFGPVAHDVRFEVEGASKEEAEALIDRFWERVRSGEMRPLPRETAADLALIRARMDELGWSQAELAQRAGIKSQSMISMVLNQKTGLKPKLRIALLRALGLHRGADSK